MNAINEYLHVLRQLPVFLCRTVQVTTFEFTNYSSYEVVQYHLLLLLFYYLFSNQSENVVENIEICFVFEQNNGCWKYLPLPVHNLFINNRYFSGK